MEIKYLFGQLSGQWESKRIKYLYIYLHFDYCPYKKKSKACNPQVIMNWSLYLIHEERWSMSRDLILFLFSRVLSFVNTVSMKSVLPNPGIELAITLIHYCQCLDHIYNSKIRSKSVKTATLGLLLRNKKYK